MAINDFSYTDLSIRRNIGVKNFHRKLTFLRTRSENLANLPEMLPNRQNFN